MRSHTDVATSAPIAPESPVIPNENEQLYPSVSSESSGLRSEAQASEERSRGKRQRVRLDRDTEVEVEVNATEPGEGEDGGPGQDQDQKQAAQQAEKPPKEG